MKRGVFLLTCMFLQVFFVLSAGELENNSAVKVGQLQNGFTYYIQKNGYPQEKASLRLVVKAGSLHEEEHQRGIAHFVEHMVFRGSKHFADYEIIEYLESIGAKFGPDANAYTSFDHTCYMLEVPINRDDALNKTMLILSDWAGRATLSDEYIERERNVILDELNGSTKNCYWKQTVFEINHLFPSSRFVKRFPIGLPEIVLRSDPSTIRDFYHKWYRPDRMALVVVGDFDIDEVEQEIVNRFSDLKRPDNKVCEIKSGLKEPSEIQTSVFIHPEIVSSSVAGLRFCKEETTPFTLKNYMIKKLANKSVNKRLSRAGKKVGALFLHAHHSLEEELFFTDLKGDQLTITCYDERPYEGLLAVCQELKNLQVGGLTESEFETLRQSEKNTLEKRLQHLDRIPHSYFASNLQSNFMRGDLYPSEERLLAVEKKLIDKISLEDVSNWIASHISLDSFHLFFRASQEEIFTKNEALKIREEIEKLAGIRAEERPLVELEVNAPEPSALEITKEAHESNNITKFTLQNGMKVLLCQREQDVGKDEVFIGLQTQHKGIFLQESEYASLDNAGILLRHSGIANLDSDELADFLQVHGIDYNISMSPLGTKLFLSGKEEKIEELFKLIYGVFKERRYDFDIWKSFKQKMSQIEKNQENFPEAYFELKAKELITNGHPLYKYFRVEEASKTRAVEICDKAFQDPSAFTLYIVGDIDLDDVKTLIEKYIHSIDKANSSIEISSFPDNVFAKQSGRHEIKRGEDTQHLVCYAIPISIDEKVSKKMYFAKETFLQLFASRLFKNLREVQGQTYNIELDNMLPFYPHQTKESLTYLIFSCLPEVSDTLIAEVENEIQRFLETGVTEEEIAGAREAFLNSQRTFLKTNRDLLHLLMKCDQIEINYLKYLDREKFVKSYLTKESVDSIGRLLLSQDARLLITLDPENS